MYQLAISGYGYRKRVCEDVVDWFITKFLPRHKLHIGIEHRGLIREDALGFCDIDSDYGDINRPRDFSIDLQSHLPQELYIITLLHELVHLRQWVRGQLKYRSGRLLFNTQRVSEIPYHNQPHEIEAYALEYRLYLDYMFDTTGNWYGDE